MAQGGLQLRRLPQGIPQAAGGKVSRQPSSLSIDIMQRMNNGRGSENPQGKVRVWDAPTRIFHWLLAALVLVAWASWRYSESLGDHTLALHRWNGHAILVLIVFRVLWGFAGSSTSRFRAWLWWPWTAISYALRLLRGETPLYLSHNPLGSYMILALLGA